MDDLSFDLWVSSLLMILGTDYCRRKFGVKGWFDKILYGATEVIGGLGLAFLVLYHLKLLFFGA